MNEKQIKQKKYYVGGKFQSMEDLRKNPVQTKNTKQVTRRQPNKGIVITAYHTKEKKLTDLQKYQKLKDIHIEIRALGIQQRINSARIRQLAQQIGEYI